MKKLKKILAIIIIALFLALMIGLFTIILSIMYQKSAFMFFTIIGGIIFVIAMVWAIKTLDDE